MNAWFRNSTLTALAAILMAALSLPTFAAGHRNLGMVAFKNANNGRYLQAYTNGELHASNAGRNEEETWFLIEVDKDRHLYGLQNWRTGNFLSIQPPCARATSAALGATETWELISGESYGVYNAVVLRSTVENRVIGIGPNICGGEASAPTGYNRNEIPRSSNWPGFWVVESVGAPTPGRDAWNTIGQVFQGIFNNVDPIDLAALMLVLL